MSKKDVELTDEVIVKRQKLCLDIIGKTKRMDILVGEEDMKFIQDIAKNTSRSRRQVVNMLVAKLVDKKRKMNDLTLEI